MARAAASAALAAYTAVSDMDGYRAFAAAVDATDVAAAAAGVAADYAGAEAYASVNYDAEAIGRGEDARQLARMQLWPGDIPPVIQRRWKNFVHGKPKIVDGRWEVWIEWYEDRLIGAGQSRPVIEELEIARVLIPDEEWEQGPGHANKLIQDLEDQYRPVDPDLEDQRDIPAQRPAVIEVQEGDDGRLERKAPDPPHLDDEAREQRLRAAWAAHDQALSALQALNPGRNEPGLTHALAAYREAMGATFDDLNVIALGTHGERLIAYTVRIDDLLIGSGAAELAALVALHGLFVRQFEEWRQYIGDGRPDPTPEVVAAAAAIARETKNFPNLFSGELIDVAVELAEAATLPLTADPADRLPRAVTLGVVDSDINILSGLATQVPRYLRDAGGRARKGSLDGVENASRRATEAGLFFGLGAIGTLITGLPGELSFLTGIIALLKSGGGSSADSDTRKIEASPRETGDDDGEDDRVY